MNTNSPITGTTLKIAAIQMVSTPDMPTNLAQALQLIEQAAHSGAELVVLPEYFCLMGYNDAGKLEIQEDFGHGTMQDTLSKAAKRYGIYLHGGTLPLRSPVAGKVMNTSLVWKPNGELAARYDKIHLFRFDNGRESYDEGLVLQAGDTPVTFDLHSRGGHKWRVGLSVCYDMRFPELYRRLQADLILVPAAFTYTTGQAHWELLLRARAVENLAFVLASAQGGEHENGRRTWGHSMVIDPWGKVLAQLESRAGVVQADLDWNAMQQMRAQLPALNHRVFSA